MLKDQVFLPIPIIALGPEVFYDKDSFNSINFPLLSKFSTKFLQVPAFHFAYAASTQSVYPVFDILGNVRKMGMRFHSIYLVNSESLQSAVKFREATIMFDWILSPELCKRVDVTNLIQLPDKVEALILALECFSGDANIPYSKENFRKVVLDAI